MGAIRAGGCRAQAEGALVARSRKVWHTGGAALQTPSSLAGKQRAQGRWRYCMRGLPTAASPCLGCPSPQPQRLLELAFLKEWCSGSGSVPKRLASPT